MGVTISVNNMSVAHKGSGGISIIFPDVCKTPSPGGPIPIPYPNIARSSDTAKGSKKVKMDGESIMLKGSNYSMSTGDEAGSAGGGILTSKIKGKAEFMLYSFDVKVEGKAVCRLLDIMGQNKGSEPSNTPPGTNLQGPVVVIDMSKVGKDKDEACDKLEEKKVENHDEAANRAGMLKEDYDAIRDVCADNNALVSFRQTNPACMQHQKNGVPSKGLKVKAHTGSDGLVKGYDNLTGDYDMHDMITSSSGNRIRGESVKDFKLREAMNDAIPGDQPRIMHGAQANYGDYLKGNSGEKPTAKLFKPDVSLEKPVTAFDGKTQPATVYQLESNEDIVNMYRCKGTNMPKEWDIRDQKTGKKIGAKIK